jgi:tetratricopeptide (TPR) repeat protein
MINKQQRNDLLDVLKITRWDFLPYEAGEIRFITADNMEVAKGNYKIILSHGPGEEYTMAWAIDIYKSMKAPVIDKIEGLADKHENKSQDDAEAKAFEIGKQLKVDFVINAMHMFVAVFNFHLTDPQIVEAWNLEERIELLIADLVKRKPPQPVLEQDKVQPSAMDLAKESKKALRSGKYQKAVDGYTQVLDLLESGEDFDAEFAIIPHEIYSNRALAKKKLGDFQGAVDDYTVAISLKKDVAAIYRMRAETYDQLNEYQKAIADLETSLKLEPESNVALYNISCYYARIGDKSKALESLKNLFEKYPEEKESVADDSDFVSLKDDEGFQELIKN